VIPRAVLLAALLPLCALAQLQIFEVIGTTETPVLGTLVNVGTAAPGNTIEARFRVRNTGASPAVLQTILLSGAGFTILLAPSLPYTLAPYTGAASEAEIDIDFSPTLVASYSATFVVNTINTILEGSAVPSVVVTVGSSTAPLSAGATVNFGSVNVGSTATENLILSNTSHVGITVGTLAVSGTGFAGPIGLTAPLTLSAGQAASFQVSFTPQSGTLAQGVLTVGQQMFNLTGEGVGSAAQLQVFEVIGTTDTAVGALVNVGTAAPGDTITTRFQVRNMGSGPAVLQSVKVSGNGFTIQSVTPTLPITLAPYTGTVEAEIDVNFRPTLVGSYSATLLINTTSITLQGTAAQLAVLTVGSSTTPLSAGATVSFGSVDVGSTKTQGFYLSNPSSASVTVGSVTVSGTGFTLAPGLTLPVQIVPEGPKVPFQIIFSPEAGTLAGGTLTVDTRTFDLTGQGLSALLPTASIDFASTVGASGQQNSVSIPLASASKVSGSGTLALAFQSSVNGVSGDPSIVFASGPHYLATVSIAPGDTSAKIGGQSSMTFQTGATAGTITITLTLNDQTQQAKLTIPPSPINLSDDTISAVRLFGSLNVSLGGIDNTYSASQLAFTFYDLNGLPLPQGAITVDEASAFKQYFNSTQAGGMFQVLAEFPVTGNTALIGFVTAQITNSQGTSTAPQIPFGN
jgi:hypothetical protein